MSSTTVGSMADQIVAEIEDGLAHQRHKWAAQCQAHGLSMTHFHVLALLDADGPTARGRLADQLGVAFSNLTGIENAAPSWSASRLIGVGPSASRSARTW